MQNNYAPQQSSPDPASVNPVPTKDNAPPTIVAWWYRIAAPPPVAGASLEQQDLLRRGRLTSIILFFEFLILAGAFVVVTQVASPIMIPPMAGLVLLVLVAIFFNRKGRINTAGVIVVFAFEVAAMLDIATTPGGIDSFTLPMFDILVQSVLLTVSLLPSWTVFITAAVNVIFIIVTLHAGLPITPALAAKLANPASAADAHIRPIVLEVLTAVVTFLWVQGHKNMVRRANRAEEIARLEHHIASQKQLIAQQKEQLDTSIHYISDALTRVANGDTHARIPTNRGGALWQIEGKINTLLSRLQRLRGLEQENKRLQYAIDEFAYAIRQGRAHNRPVRLRTSSPLAEVYYELVAAKPTNANGTTVVNPPAVIKNDPPQLAQHANQQLPFPPYSHVENGNTRENGNGNGNGREISNTRKKAWLEQQ